MRALVQRISEAAVRVNGAVVGQSGPGLLVLVCAMREDTEIEAAKLATKIAKLRIFRDDTGKMNLSLRDTGGTALVISQFTLAADTKGNRPGFSTAADPTTGEALYIAFTEQLRAQEVHCETGIFGADMKVSLTNDGPVTIWLDTERA